MTFISMRSLAGLMAPLFIVAIVTINLGTRAQDKPGHEATTLSFRGPELVLEGEASYYSWRGCLGCNRKRIMANGEVLNDNKLTMAIGADKVKFVGRQARITNLENGQSVIVKITDTGGFYQEKYGRRVADLTIATKNAIGMGDVGQVRIEVF